jgi:hypothetical protein
MEIKIKTAGGSWFIDKEHSYFINQIYLIRLSDSDRFGLSITIQ